jgi:predicted amidophosphoribosyltransferase
MKTRQGVTIQPLDLAAYILQCQEYESYYAACCNCLEKFQNNGTYDPAIAPMVYNRLILKAGKSLKVYITFDEQKAIGILLLKAWENGGKLS